MEASTTIKGMISHSYIYVPNYQRAYSWDTPTNSKDNKTQVDIFYKDLENYINSNSKVPYYFGHFLYELKNDNKYAIIDGQQRLTTIMIFLSALFHKMKEISTLTDEEEEIYEDLVIRRNKLKFETVKYDNQIYKDFVIYNKEINPKILETESSKRFVSAYFYFSQQLKNKNKLELTNLMKVLINSSCTTHIVKEEAEAIQMFIFQNNRGKKPSNLEIIKAQFMYYIHLNSKENSQNIIDEINFRFENIYNSITKLENNINEDEILLYTLKIYNNSLWEENAIEKINYQLLESDAQQFILNFSKLLEENFYYLINFFGTDQTNNINVHSLIVLGLDNNIFPFILKAYKYNLNISQFNNLCQHLEKILLRNKIISTRADIRSRINDIFKTFDGQEYTLSRIINVITELISNPNYYWWAYWSSKEFSKALHEKINSQIAKYILWKYENFLIYMDKGMYMPLRYNSIDFPELEHIAPQTPKKEEVAKGYPEYTDEFRNKYLDSLGNYLLISKKHNSSIGNKNLKTKLETYTYLYQQREVVKMCLNKKKWSQSLIFSREKKIIEFILNNL